MLIFILSVCSYLFGSFPTAFIFSKLKFGEDIRTVGSGNVGAINFLRYSKSGFLSFFVLLLDVVKGGVAIWISQKYLPLNLLIFPSLFVILGHIFPVWLKFRGGRGMATLAGVFLMVQPLAVVIWWIFFLAAYLPFRKLVTSGISALILTNLCIIFIWEWQIFLISSSATLLVMTRYLDRLKQELLPVKAKGADLGTKKNGII